jgi:undecaprenyl-diphosphatase
MNFLQIAVLAVIQGLAELLPISSSAHVIVAEKLMGLDPSSPEMTLLLVMLHTGTMVAVIVYFWKDWDKHYFQQPAKSRAFLVQIGIATIATLILGYILKTVIEKVILREIPNAEIEMIFGNLRVISFSLFLAGVLILFASLREKHTNEKKSLGALESTLIGLMQGLCVPFRGFSRSGATISAGMILGIAKRKAEEFSFALAVVLTPFALGKEMLRLLKSHSFSGLSLGQAAGLFAPGLLGMVLSFLAGLLALRWLSSWLEKGRWGWFGFYCLVASAAVWWMQQLP